MTNSASVGDWLSEQKKLASELAPEANLAREVASSRYTCSTWDWAPASFGAVEAISPDMPEKSFWNSAMVRGRTALASLAWILAASEAAAWARVSRSAGFIWDCVVQVSAA